MPLPKRLPENDIHRYFVYEPSEGASIFFFVFFAILTAALFYQSYKRRQWWIMSLTLMSALESSGYLARYLLIIAPNGNSFKSELIILILAPNLLALCCYILIGKIITYVFYTKAGDSTAPTNWITRHPHWIPYFYLMSDLICISIQGAGGGMLSGAKTTAQLNAGKTVELIGLGTQLGFIGTFVVICIYVWMKMKEQSQKLCDELAGAYTTLVTIIVLLVLRNIYRMMEFSTGSFTTGPFQNNEAWYLAWDPTLMSLALLVAILYDFTTRLPEDCLNPPAGVPKTMEMGNLKQKEAATDVTDEV